MKHPIRVNARAAGRRGMSTALGGGVYGPIVPRRGSWSPSTKLVPLALALLLAGHSGIAAVETWTDAAGQSITATYSGMENGMAVFVTADGKRLPIAPDKLDAESQKRLQAQQSKAQPAKAPAAKRRGLLQTIELPSFDMTVSAPRGTVELQPKLNGMAAGESIKVNLGGDYKIGEKPYKRRILGFSKEPVLRPDGFTISANMEDGVQAELYAKAEKNEVVLGYKVVEPADIKHKARYTLGLRMAPILKYDEPSAKYVGFLFPKPLAIEEIPSKLAGIELTAKLAKERLKFTYSANIPKLFHDAESARIAGSYGPGSMISLDPPKQGSLSASIYRESRLFEGYWFTYRKVDQTAPADQIDQVLKVTFGANP